jgi:hypothetical protein
MACSRRAFDRCFEPIVRVLRPASTSIFFNNVSLGGQLTCFHQGSGTTAQAVAFGNLGCVFCSLDLYPIPCSVTHRFSNWLCTFLLSLEIRPSEDTCLWFVWRRSHSTLVDRGDRWYSFSRSGPIASTFLDGTANNYQLSMVLYIHIW